MLRLFAPHPMNSNVAWATGFDVEFIGSSILFIHDVTTGSGMSVTNNMEFVLKTICRHLSITVEELSTKCTIFSIEDGAVYKVEHEDCTNPKWTYMGPDDKAIRVLYANN